MEKAQRREKKFSLFELLSAMTLTEAECQLAVL